MLLAKFDLLVGQNSLKIEDYHIAIIVRFWIAWEVWINICFRFFNNENVHFLKLGPIYVGSVPTLYLEYKYFLEV